MAIQERGSPNVCTSSGTMVGKVVAAFSFFSESRFLTFDFGLLPRRLCTFDLTRSRCPVPRPDQVPRPDLTGQFPMQNQGKEQILLANPPEPEGARDNNPVAAPVTKEGKGVGR